MSTRNEDIQKMKAELDQFNVKMTELEASASVGKAAADAVFHTELEKLKAQSALARTKLEDLRNEGVKNWETMIAEMDKVRDALVHSAHYFKSQLQD